MRQQPRGAGGQREWWRKASLDVRCGCRDGGGKREREKTNLDRQVPAAGNERHSSAQGSHAAPLAVVLPVSPGSAPSTSHWRFHQRTTVVRPTSQPCGIGASGVMGSLEGPAGMEGNPREVSRPGLSLKDRNVVGRLSTGLAGQLGLDSCLDGKASRWSGGGRVRSVSALDQCVLAFVAKIWQNLPSVLCFGLASSCLSSPSLASTVLQAHQAQPSLDRVRDFCFCTFAHTSVPSSPGPHELYPPGCEGGGQLTLHDR